MLKPFKIAVFGEAMLDVYQLVETLGVSQEEKTCPKYNILQENWYAGGAANVAVQLAKLDTQVMFCGNVTTKIGKILSENNIWFDIEEPFERFVRTRIVDNISKKHLVRIDKNPKVCPSEIQRLPEEEYDLDAIIVADYNHGEISTKTFASIRVYQSRHPKTKVYINSKNSFVSFIKGIHIFCCNNKEYQQLKFIPDADYVIITNGAGGAQMAGRKQNEYLSLNSTKDKAVDVTGAGDVFLSTFVIAELNGANPYEALKIANNSAGLKVTKTGTEGINKEEFEKIIADS